MWSNSVQQFRLGTSWIEGNFAGKRWEILVYKKDVKQTWGSNAYFRCTYSKDGQQHSRSVASRPREVKLPIWNIATLVCVQWRVIKMLMGVQHMAWERRLRKTGFFDSQGKRRVRRHLIVLNNPISTCRKSCGRLFSELDEDGTSSNHSSTNCILKMLAYQSESSGAEWGWSSWERDWENSFFFSLRMRSQESFLLLFWSFY